MNNTHKTHNKPLQTAISRIAVGATSGKKQAKKKQSKKKSELNLHVLPLGVVALIHDVKFMPYTDADYYIKVKKVGRNTRVSVDDGEFDYLEKVTAEKRVKIINRGLVRDNTAIEVDVIVEKYHTPSPKKPAAGKNNKVSYLKRAALSTTIGLFSMPVAAATPQELDPTWVWVGLGTLAAFIFINVVGNLSKTKSKKSRTPALLSKAKRKGYDIEQLAKRWRCSTRQVNTMISDPTQMEKDAFNGLPQRKVKTTGKQRQGVKA